MGICHLADCQECFACEPTDVLAGEWRLQIPPGVGEWQKNYGEVGGMKRAMVLQGNNGINRIDEVVLRASIELMG